MTPVLGWQNAAKNSERIQEGYQFLQEIMGALFWNELGLLVAGYLLRRLYGRPLLMIL